MLSLYTPPSSEPIAVQEAKEQCRIDGTDEEALIGGYIVAARQYVENATGRQLITATWDLALDGFPCWIDVPLAPLQSVSSVSYIDPDGVTQTWASSNYKLIGALGASPTHPNPTAPRARLERAYGIAWPATRYESANVTIRFVAGYGDRDKVPAALKQAMLLLIGHWYENRQQVVIGTTSLSAVAVPFAVDALIGPYRTWPIESESWRSVAYVTA